MKNRPLKHKAKNDFQVSCSTRANSVPEMMARFAAPEQTEVMCVRNVFIVSVQNLRRADFGSGHPAVRVVPRRA